MQSTSFKSLNLRYEHMMENCNENEKYEQQTTDFTQ